MNYKETIAREEDYKCDLRTYYNSILNGRLLNIDVDNLSDAEIMKFVIDFDNENNVINNNFCTWLTIGDTITSIYNGCTYKSVNFLSSNNSIFNINFSQFKYPMSLGKTDKVVFPSFNLYEAKYVCLIDEKSIQPELFFSENKGEKLLLIYSFPVINKFNKEKTCYFFAHKNISPTFIRKYLKYAQRNTIEDIIKYPTMYSPGTTIKIDFEDSQNQEPIYHHYSISETTKKFALSLFNEEFKCVFEMLFKKVTEI